MTAPRPQLSPPPAALAAGAAARAGQAGRWLARVSDAQLAALVALPLFVLAARPLLLVDLPPLQDLPNHVATAHIIAHPELYPEYAFNGFAKSNSLLTLWLVLAGGHGLYGATRGFVAAVLAAGALALPAFVLRFAGRDRLLVATLFVWPLVHGFFVSMGMLNFAFAFALSLVLLVLLDRQRERATAKRGAGIAALSLVLWYAHPFPLAVVGALIALYVATRPNWRARGGAGLVLLAPLVPAGLFSVAAAAQHLIKAEPAAVAVAAASVYLSPLDEVEHLWLDASGAFTWLGCTTVVPALLLPYLAWRSRRERAGVPLLSTAALVLLALAYVVLPFMMSNWWYLDCRLVPFLWAVLAVRLPSRLRGPLVALLAACALAFSAATAIDYVRLDRERAEFTAGVAAVPERATLLPLLFAKRKTSHFTASLTHAWAYYAIAKNTSTPLVFAAERSYPISYRSFPPPALIAPGLDRLAELDGTPARMCDHLGPSAEDPSCTVRWRGFWAGFWRQAEPRFSHLLTWAMPTDARRMIPEQYRRVFAAGELEIWARAPVVGSGQGPP